MDCNVIGDLIPLYADGCCSEESAALVKEHIGSCEKCRKLYEECKKLPDEMTVPSDVSEKSDAPARLSRISERKAAVLQSVLLYVSFLLITVGVALEAGTPTGLSNGFWALNIVIPSTGFMLSLANWYFVRVYKSRKLFSTFSLLATLGITLGAYVWAILHYGKGGEWFGVGFYGESVPIGEIEPKALWIFILLHGIGLFLTALFCILSKVLSDRYAKMLGKE